MVLAWWIKTSLPLSVMSGPLYFLSTNSSIWITHRIIPCYIKEGSQSLGTKRNNVVVIVCPHISPDPDGLNYEQIVSKSWFCKPIREEIQLLRGHNTLTEAYAEYMNTGNAPLGWHSPIRHTVQGSNEENENSDEAEASTCTYSGQESRTRHVGVICQHRA